MQAHPPGSRGARDAADRSAPNVGPTLVGRAVGLGPRSSGERRRPAVGLLAFGLSLFAGGGASAQEDDVRLFSHAGEAGARHGAALALLGDQDGDGWPELAIGAPRGSGPAGSTGRPGAVEVRSGVTGALLWRAAGLDDGERFGAALCTGADLDGDGRAELWVGAPGGSGRVAALGVGGVVREFAGTEAGAGFGAALAALGDVDGDGVEDLAVGAPGSGAGAFGGGRVVVLSGADGAELWSAVGTGFLDRLGTALAAVDDLDGDGWTDLAVGVPFADAGGFNAGAVELRSGRDGALLMRIDGLGLGDRLGERLAVAGDVDGDGRREVLAGAPGADLGGVDSGGAWLLSSADGAVLATVAGPGPGQFAAAVAGLGDVDGDGVGDLALGAEAADGRGRVRIVSAAGGAPLVELDGLAAGGWFGAAVADAGDLNADGIPDLAVGAPGDEDRLDAIGHAHLLSSAPLSLWSDGHALEPGGEQRLEAEFAGLGGQAYLVLGSLGGPVADSPTPLAIAVDAYTLACAAGDGPLLGGSGLLDPAGRTSVRFLPPSTTAAFVPLAAHHQCLVFDPATGGPLAASAPVAAWITDGARP